MGYAKFKLEWQKIFIDVIQPNKVINYYERRRMCYNVIRKSVVWVVCGGHRFNYQWVYDYTHGNLSITMSTVSVYLGNMSISLIIDWKFIFSIIDFLYVQGYIPGVSFKTHHLKLE